MHEFIWWYLIGKKSSGESSEGVDSNPKPLEDSKTSGDEGNIDELRESKISVFSHNGNDIKHPQIESFEGKVSFSSMNL